MNQTVDLEQQSFAYECATTIKAMLKQENSGYVVSSYLEQLPPSTSLGPPVDAIARSTIADWCVKIMDVCQYQRETAAIAISYLDRFMASPDGYNILVDRKLFQLAALACVYCAVKLHEQQVLGPELVAKLSNGERTSTDIEKMELRLLQALRWRVNPPTAMAFVRNHLYLIPESDLDALTRQALLDLTQYQIEISILKYEFAIEKASAVGLAALLNAADSICDDGSLFDAIESLILKCTNIQVSTLSILRNKLYELICSNDTSASLPYLPALRKPTSGFSSYTKTEGDSFSASPRTVQLS